MIWLQRGCGLGSGEEDLDGYEECGERKAFQPRHASSPQAARAGVGSRLCGQPEAAPLVLGVGQPMGVELTRPGRAEQPVYDLQDRGRRTEQNLLELSLGALAGRVAQVSL